MLAAGVSPLIKRISAIEFLKYALSAKRTGIKCILWPQLISKCENMKIAQFHKTMTNTSSSNVSSNSSSIESFALTSSSWNCWAFTSSAYRPFARTSSLCVPKKIHSRKLRKAFNSCLNLCKKRQRFIQTTFFNDVPFVKNNDAIGSFHCWKSMCNYNCGSAFGSFVQCILK